MSPFYKSKVFQQAIPFMILVVGGSILLREFAKIRYKYRRVTTVDVPKEAKAVGIELKKPVTLEEEYEKTMEKVDLDNWENVRIPRPWEETNTTQ